MSVKVQTVCDWINEFAPFELAEEWDNVGLLVGDSEKEIECVLCALDLNPGTIREAIEIGAGLIVTHHPVMFRGRKNLRVDDPEGRMLTDLILNDIAMIAAHTNFDNADPGVNNALAAKLELTDVKAYPNGMRVGTTDRDTLGEFTRFVSEKLSAPVRRYGEPERSVQRVALLGGAGGDFCDEAIEVGADVFLTGEISHHKAWDAYLKGLCALEGGHAATELPAIEFMAGRLIEKAKNADTEVRVQVSGYSLFR